jgi:hypothetical protein
LRHSAAPGCGPRDEPALDKLAKNAYARRSPEAWGRHNF